MSTDSQREFWYRHAADYQRRAADMAEDGRIHADRGNVLTAKAIQFRAAGLYGIARSALDAAAECPE